MIRFFFHPLAVVCVVAAFFLPAFAQEPASRAWVEAMWSNSNTRPLIKEKIERHGIAFLPTDGVRADLLNNKGLDPLLVQLLTRRFAKNVVFVVCKFKCQTCGSSTSHARAFNDVVLDRLTYVKGLVGGSPNDPLFGKRLYEGLGDENGPPANLRSPIIVFVTGHIQRDGPRVRISARLSYKDKGLDAAVLGTKDFDSGTSRDQLRQVARDIARWSIDMLKVQTQ